MHVLLDLLGHIFVFIPTKYFCIWFISVVRQEQGTQLLVMLIPPFDCDEGGQGIQGLPQ